MPAMNIPSVLQRISVLLFLLTATSCQKPAATSSAPPPAPNSGSPAAPAITAPAVQGKITPAEPSSFDAVARNLDSGGGLYFYLSTEAFMQAAAKKLTEFEPLILSVAKISPDDKAKGEQGWKALSGLVADSGIGDVSGFGVSSIALEPGYYQTKWMFHHYPGKGNGFLWNLSGTESRAMEIIPFLPTTTALAASWDLTLAPAWDAILKAAGANPEMSKGLQMATQQFEQSSGLSLANLLKGIGPNYSLVLTLDEKRVTSLPAGATGGTVTIPEPTLGIIVQIRDEALIQPLEREIVKIPGIIQADRGDLKVRVIPVPAPLPFIHPAIAWSKDRIMIVSNEALIQEMLDVKAGRKPGLASLPDYKKLAAGFPEKGAQFQFVSPSFRKTVAEFQKIALKQPGMDDGAKRILEYMIQNTDQGWVCAAAQNTPEGFLGIAHGQTGPAQIATVGMVVPAALVTAIAVPNFTRAKGRSEASRILEDARMIDAACDQWVVEHNKKTGDQPTATDLKVYIKTNTPLWKNMDAAQGQTTVKSSVGDFSLLIPKADSTEIIPRTVLEHFRPGCNEEFWKPFLTK